MKLTREFYKLDKLAGAKIYIPTEVDGLEFCLYEHNSGAWKDGELVNDHYFAQCFRGKQTKPAWHYNFGNSNNAKQNRDKFIQNEIKEQKQRLEYKAEQRKKALEPHTWKENDIVYESWGYDQTNVDFYKVKNLIGKCTAVLQKIGKKTAPDSYAYGHGMARDVIADDRLSSGDTFKVRIHNNMARMRGNYSYASLWNGNPTYESWYA